MTPKGKVDPSMSELKSELQDAFLGLLSTERNTPPRADFAGQALERRSISEQVANRILAMIKSGNLKSGDQLPTEAQMTLAFSISRPPLRGKVSVCVMR
mgnify:CR=1 FL=1